MRYRLMATYQGQPYEAGIGPSEGDVVLFAACPPPEELGFEPATGHWRKQLRIRDVEALWESRPTGTFRGEPCIILDDLGDRLHIAFLGHDAYLAERLGFWQVDRGVFELITPRDEVIEVVEERTDYPPRFAARQQVPGAGAPDPGFGPPAPHGVALPPYAEAPLPLEAAALRATSAAARHQPPARELLAHEPAAHQSAAQPRAGRERSAQGRAEPSPRRRRAAPRRLATQRIFSELAGLAAIPAAAYAVGAEVDGAMCLLQTEHGYEVFNAIAGARHEVRLFDDEESAYFYLFGVLAAEAVRTGGLVPHG
jgi:hypothetical protein